MLSSKVIVLGATLLSSAAMANIQGLYQSDCAPADEPGLSTRTSVNFGKQMARQVKVIYGDDTCTKAAWAFDFQGPYTLAADGALDLTSTVLKLYPLDANVAISFNQISFCGLTDWKLNQPTNINGLDCRGVQFPAEGFVSFDRVSEVEGGIVFGAISEQLDGSTPAKRPVNLDQANVFKAVGN